jgi:hypothetical protein
MPAQSRLYLTILAISLCAPVPPAQTAAGITNHALPVSGFLSAIDVTGSFFAGKTGPVTAGAPQTRGGGGTCFINVFPVGSLPQPCSDAYVGKVDPEGNLIFGTFLGGPTADEATAVADSERLSRRERRWEESRYPRLRIACCRSSATPP